jgi:hypothetical protein
VAPAAAAPAAARPALDFEGFSAAVESPPTPPGSSWRPAIVRLAPGDRPRFAALCERRGIAVLDTIGRQLADLAVVRLPATERAPERQRFVEDALRSAGDPAAYGVWAYLPWAAKVAHLLPPDDYYDVITDRNRDKITRAEQQALRAKRVGVLGLSVGGEAAVTVAQEHLCGHLVLADFDRLDLSNLNRLQAGFDDLGVPKTTIVARRVAAIDPFIEVTVFDDGVTASNADAFLDGLDLLVEECDGLAIKYDVRRLAKARGLDVVYAADERGFLSVEPYRAWRDLAPFHGRVEHRPPPREAFPTPAAFMRALAEWLGGWENLSERSRRSLDVIGESLSGYPQLAGEARYAAAQVAHVARRLLLGERLPPVLTNLDLADLIPAGRA